MTEAISDDRGFVPVRARIAMTVFLIVLLVVVLAGEALGSSGDTLSVEQAQAEVTRYFPVAEKKITASRLIQPIEIGGNPAWNLTFENGSNALVDAVTGKIKQFSSVPTAATTQGKLTPSQAQEIVLKLIGQMYPERVQQVAPDPIRPAQPSGAGLAILFTRMVNGALFPANGFRVSVNPDGSIATFQTQWQDSLTFPNPERLIGDRAAIKAAVDLLTQNPQAFLFYQTVAPGQPPKLFYLIKTAIAEMALDAQTGLPAGGPATPLDRRRDWTPILRGLGLGAVWILSLAGAFLLGRRLDRWRRRSTPAPAGMLEKGGENELQVGTGDT